MLPANNKYEKYEDFMIKTESTFDLGIEVSNQKTKVLELAKLINDYEQLMNEPSKLTFKYITSSNTVTLGNNSSLVVDAGYYYADIKSKDYEVMKDWCKKNCTRQFLINKYSLVLTDEKDLSWFMLRFS